MKCGIGTDGLQSIIVIYKVNLHEADKISNESRCKAGGH